jgi:UDP-N-acetylglucosamine 4,6-dehydratase
LTSDKLFIAANNFAGGHEINLFVIQYGNVMGSRRSVIPFLSETKEKRECYPSQMNA